MLNKWLCALFGHKYRVVQKFSKATRRVKCTRCPGDWGMNDSVKALLPWDSDLEQMYQDFGNTILEPKF